MNPKVLLVDDEKSVREYLSKILSAESISVKSCSDSSQARDLLKFEDFNVLVIDIILPDQSGLDFIKEIQAEGIELPIIAITGSRELEYAQEAVRLQVFDYLIKPFQNQHLIQAVKNAHTKFILEKEKRVLDNQKDEYRDTLEDEVHEKIRKLKESEEKYRNLVEQFIVGVTIIYENEIVYNNKKFATTFGYESCEELNHHRFIDLVSSQKQESVQMKMDVCLTQKLENPTFKFPAHKKSGENIYIQAWVSSISYEEDKALLVLLMDITDQQVAAQREKKYQLELIKENRMAAIGQLASGIAHNLNTPISIIQGNAELLSMKFNNSNEVDMILKQTQRMNDLIYTIVSKGRYELNNEDDGIDINQLIFLEIEFFNSNLYFKHHIDCKLELEPNLPIIHGRYSDFSQSISVLIQNSIDAMYKREKRELLIKTKKIDENIELVISDTGNGMDSNTKNRIFETFFTTKASPDEKLTDSNAPRGTGLGLSMVKNIFKKCGISYKIDTKVEQGTTFTLTIPIGN